MKRAQLGLSKTEFVKRFTSAGNRAFYSHMVSGRHAIPNLWYLPIAELLGISAEEVALLAVNASEIDAWMHMSDRKFSAEELYHLASIAEFVGESLPLKNLIRISKEIKAAASK